MSKAIKIGDFGPIKKAGLIIRPHNLGLLKIIDAKQLNHLHCIVNLCFF